jgi:N-methylhydantoinase A
MHAVALARSFGISRIVVPHLSSVFSALGCVTAELRYTQQHTLRMASGAWDQARLDGVRAGIARELAARFEAAGDRAPPAKEVAALRYSGQSYAIEIQDPAFHDPDALGRQFTERHEALYGFATEEPWELVALRVSLSAPRAGRPEQRAAESSEPPGPTHETPCWFDGTEPVATPRYYRETLGAGAALAGPAIVEDDWSTVVLPPGATLEVDGSGHLHIDAGEGVP